MDLPQQYFEHKGWQCTSNRAPMLNTEQLNNFASSINFTGSLPECLFGGNSLRLVNAAKNIEVCFKPDEALLGCFLESDTRKFEKFQPVVPQVRFAESWQASHQDIDHFSKVIRTNYDWTFTSGYRGTVSDARTSKILPMFECNADTTLPVERLSDRNDPILWYDRIDFWLDDLSDCGVSQSNCRIRVNESYWYILYQFQMRVDHVVVTQIDTRMFHDFETNHIIRDFTWKVTPYSKIKERKEDQRSFDKCVREEDTEVKETVLIYAPNSTGIQ